MYLTDSLLSLCRYLAALTGFLQLASELVTIEGVVIYNPDTLEMLQEFPTTSPNRETMAIELYRSGLLLYCYVTETNLRESNIFTGVCQSFCPRGTGRSST